MFSKCGEAVALEQSAYYRGFGLDKLLHVIPLMPVKVFSSVWLTLAVVSAALSLFNALLSESHLADIDPQRT